MSSNHFLLFSFIKNLFSNKTPHLRFLFLSFHLSFRKLFTFSETQTLSFTLKPSTMASSANVVFDINSLEIRMEHHFDLNILKEYNVDVSNYIKAAGWEGYFSKPVSMFPDLIRAFWRQPTITATDVKAMVLNTKVIVSEATIATAINCPQSGLTLNDKWEEDLGGEEVMVDILMRPDTGDKAEWKAANMKDEARVLHQILNKAIIHKSGSKNNIFMTHKFCLCHLFIEAAVNMPNLLFNLFRNYVLNKDKSTAIPYAVLLRGNSNLNTSMSCWHMEVLRNKLHTSRHMVCLLLFFEE